MEGGGEGVWMETRKEVSATLRDSRVGAEIVPFSYCGSGYTDPPRKRNCREFHSICNLVQLRAGKPKLGELYYYQNPGCDTL